MFKNRSLVRGTGEIGKQMLGGPFIFTGLPLFLMVKGLLRWSSKTGGLAGIARIEENLGALKGLGVEEVIGGEGRLLDSPISVSHGQIHPG